MPVKEAASPWRVWTALGLVYLFWGSTYLAIRYVVETLDPLLSASLRFFIAGGLMAVYLLVRRRSVFLAASGRQLASAAVTGMLLLLGGNGLITLAEKRGLPSSLTALLIAAVPLWVVLLRAGMHDRPERRTVSGVALGFVGVALLLLPGARPEGVALLPGLLVVVSGLLWAVGSFAATRLPMPTDPVLTTVVQMVAGGASLAVVGTAAGENLDLSEANAASLFGLAYLVVFGSIVAFSAYSWLLGVAPVSVVATYAYVNPVVAVLLGVLIAGEAVSGVTVVGGAITVFAVAVVVSRGKARQRQQQPEVTTHGSSRAS